MPEVPDSREDHCQSQPVSGFDHFLIEDEAGTKRGTSGVRVVPMDPAARGAILQYLRRRPEFRGPDKAFGLEVPVPPDAPAYQRLAGWFGRDPGWAPAGQPS